MSLEAIFSEKNLLAYSGACLDLASDLVDTKKRRFPFDTLVIPSRGAFPFFLGAIYSLDKLRYFGDDFKEIYQQIGIQPMLQPLMPPGCEISTNLKNKNLRVLLIPFTADLNIPKFDLQEDNEEYTHKTREYWARVTASFFGDSRSRMNNPYFSTFTDIILRDIENRSAVAEDYEKFPQIGKFAMIDTVISGRAANDILGSFDSIAQEKVKNGELSAYKNIPPYSFLIVDENGEKLERRVPFHNFLKDKEDKKKAKMYRIPRIVSEDENSALLGVSAVVYPSLMKASKQLQHNDKEFFIGAGSWHVTPDCDPTKHFHRFMELIYSGIDSEFERNYGDQASDISKTLERFRGIRTDYVNFADRENIIKTEERSPKFEAHIRTINRGASAVFETGSHVLHVPFTDKFTKELCLKICKHPYVESKPNDKKSAKYATIEENKRVALGPGQKYSLSLS